MDTDKFLRLPTDERNYTAPVASPTPSSSPRKRKLTRSPTPRTLADHPFLATGIDDDRLHASPSTIDPISSQNTAMIANIGSCSSGSDSLRVASNNSSNSSSSDIRGNNTIISSNNGLPFQSAKMTLFAALTRQTPEDAELARLTKANTKANRMIGKSFAPTLSPSLAALSDPEILPRENSSSSPPKTSLPPQSTMALPLFLQRNIPTGPLHMADNELGSESENENSTDSLTSSSSRSPSLSPQLSLPEFNQHRMKRRRSDLDDGHTDESNMRQLYVDLPVGVKLLSGSRQNSRTEETDEHRLSSPSMPLLLSPPQHTNPSDSFSELKSKKTVRFDETKNAVFDYQRGSTIALPNTVYDNEEMDSDVMGREGSSNTTQYSGSDPLSMWAWSSMATSKISGGPTPSDLEAASPIQTRIANHSDSAKDEGRSTREAESIMKEYDLTSSDQTYQQLSCTNTTSDLDRLWSPRVKKSISDDDVSADNLMSSTSGKIPLLRRQQSIPLMDTMGSRGLFNSEESRPLNRQNSRLEETLAIADLEPVIAPHVSQRQSGDQDVVMREEPRFGCHLQQVDRVHPITPPRRVARSERGSVRNREAAGRYYHPYRRPTIPVLDPMEPTSASSSSAAFSPPKLVRSASFTVTRQKAPPLLRRQASTTALMDTFR